jgi:hypothetical protein
VAVEKDYHTITTREGKRDFTGVENTVAALENIAAPVIQKLINGSSVDLVERQIFGVFAAQMLLRVPVRRDAAREMIASILKHFAKNWAANKESFHSDCRRFQIETGDTSDLDPERLRKFMLGDDYEMTVNSSAALGANLSTMEMVANCLVRMEWVMVRRKGRFRFLTCDNPIFYCDPTIPPNSWRGVGLMNPGVEVSFPLSPEILAFGSYHRKPRSTVEATPEIVRRFNQQTIDAAHRYIFACENSEKLQLFICRNNDRAAPVMPYNR